MGLPVFDFPSETPGESSSSALANSQQHNTTTESDESQSSTPGGPPPFYAAIVGPGHFSSYYLDPYGPYYPYDPYDPDSDYDHDFDDESDTLPETTIRNGSTEPGRESPQDGSSITAEPSELTSSRPATPFNPSTESTLQQLRHDRDHDLAFAGQFSEVEAILNAQPQQNYSNWDGTAGPSSRSTMPISQSRLEFLDGGPVERIRMIGSDEGTEDGEATDEDAGIKIIHNNNNDARRARYHRLATLYGFSLWRWCNHFLQLNLAAYLNGGGPDLLSRTVRTDEETLLLLRGTLRSGFLGPTLDALDELRRFLETWRPRVGSPVENWRRIPHIWEFCELLGEEQFAEERVAWGECMKLHFGLFPHELLDLCEWEVELGGPRVPLYSEPWF